MKIICIGRNYRKHIEELNNNIPKEICFFLKPNTAIPLKNQPFFIPDFSNNVQHEVELVVKINKNGKHISKEFSHKYYNELTIGIDFTARDIQDQLKKEGKPWEKAKAFDGSAPIGSFINKNNINDSNNINFTLLVNNQLKQKGNTRDMIFKIDEIIAYVSTFITLKSGDLIFTGTPCGVDKVHKNDVLTCHLEGQELLKIKLK